MHVRKCNVEVRQAEKSEPGELANLFGEVGEAGCHRMLRLIIQTPTGWCLTSEIGEIDIRLAFIQFNVYIYICIMYTCYPIWYWFDLMVWYCLETRESEDHFPKSYTCFGIKHCPCCQTNCQATLVQKACRHKLLDLSHELNAYFTQASFGFLHVEIAHVL